MTEEQTVASETPAEQELGSEKHTADAVAAETTAKDDAVAVKTTEQVVATDTRPEDNNPGQAAPPQAEPSIAPENQQTSSPEKPRFFSGVLFFLWVFCTLVFLSITAGYIATH